MTIIKIRPHRYKAAGVRPGKEMSDVRTRERHAAFIRYRELPSIVTVEPDE
jgi:hypothetical protein